MAKTKTARRRIPQINLADETTPAWKQLRAKAQSELRSMGDCKHGHYPAVPDQRAAAEIAAALGL